MKANYSAKHIKEVAERHMADLLKQERCKAFELALDIAIMSILLVMREEHGYGARPYGDKEPRILSLMRQINDRINGVVEKHNSDLDMAAFDLKWRLKEHGIDYALKLGERSDG